MENKRLTGHSAQDVITAAVGIRNLHIAVVALSLLAFANNAFSANRYVRPSSAGSANGTDWNNAWSMASLNANWASVQPGDTIWLAGGTYTTIIQFDQSGTSGNYISIKRPRTTDSVPTAAAGWNSGFDSQVVITPVNDSPLKWTSTSGAGSFINIDGRIANGILARYDNSANFLLGAAHFASANTHDVIIKNVDLAGPGDASAFNYQGDNAALCFNGASGNIYNISVSYCTIRGAGNLIKTGAGVDSVTIDHCVLKDNASSNPNVHANLLYNTGSRFWTISNCDISGWQVEGIILWDVGTSANWYVCGNVFHDPAPGAASCFWPGSNTPDAPQGPLFLYNNTFVNVNITTSQSRSWQFAPGSIARNNIFWNSTFAPNSVIADSDYNFSDGSIPGAHSVNSGSNPFVNMTAKNFHIISQVGATYPRNRGVPLNAQFSLDTDGVVRGSDGLWDIGEYEYGSATNPVIAVSPGSLGFGAIAVGAISNLSFTVQNVGPGTLSGSATVAAPFSIVSGGTYSLGSNQTQTVQVRFSPTAAASFNSAVVLTGGGGASVAVSGTGWTVQSGLSFDSSVGVVTAPFVTNSGGYISQPTETDLTSGGRASYAFSITTPGDYVVSASVDAAGDAANSLFVNIDGEPTDPYMIWDVLPYTSGFESRTVSWRGNGTFDNPAIAPKVFTLAVGTHQLIIRGREANAKLGRITIAQASTPQLPAPATNLRLAGP